MEERTWRRGQKADYTDRPLTEEEKRFAEEHHDYIYQFMRSYRLAVSEWYDILIISYLNAVKKYCSRPELQIYPFPAVAKKVLSCAYHHYWKSYNAQKNMPDGGFGSLDYMMEGDNLFSESRIENWWIDKKSSVEKQVILEEMFREFYEQCTYCDSDSWGDSHVNEYLKCELDLLIEGYTRFQVNKRTEKVFPHGFTIKDLDDDVKEFRKIFRKVFGI